MDHHIYTQALLKMLIDCGADISAKGADQLTCEDMLISRQHQVFAYYCYWGDRTVSTELYLRGYEATFKSVGLLLTLLTYCLFALTLFLVDHFCYSHRHSWSTVRR
jgi:hypothetical protein